MYIQLFNWSFYTILYKVKVQFKLQIYKQSTESISILLPFQILDETCNKSFPFIDVSATWYIPSQLCNWKKQFCRNKVPVCWDHAIFLGYIILTHPMDGILSAFDFKGLGLIPVQNCYN